ncbi:MAG: hypothetical protein ACRC3B_15490 [Bacteroidia bacterium]
MEQDIFTKAATDFINEYKIKPTYIDWEDYSLIKHFSEKKELHKNSELIQVFSSIENRLNAEISKIASKWLSSLNDLNRTCSYDGGFNSDEILKILHDRTVILLLWDILPEFTRVQLINQTGYSEPNLDTLIVSALNRNKSATLHWRQKEKKHLNSFDERQWWWTGDYLK